MNKNDIQDDFLEYGLKTIKYPNLLNDLVKLSREIIGFFPKTSIRMFEYPWLVDTVQNLNQNEFNLPNLKIIDIGAGVSVLPFYLAENGYTVLTIDSHPSTERKLEDMENWNEWGFLDYSLLNEKITSLREDAATYIPSDKMDIAYSISVIEHMPSDTRKKLIQNVSNWLEEGGFFLITMDLVPGKNKLWNLNEGKKVENGLVHGNLRSVLRELRKAGFEIKEEKTERNIRASRTDVVYLVCRKIK